MTNGGRYLSSANCSFCAIAAGMEPARVVLETELAVAFFPSDPATLGHTLVVPRQHIVDLWSLDVATAEFLATTTLAVARAVRGAFEPEGLNIIQSNGEAATQTVPHLHVHVLPRWRGDDIGAIWPAESHLDAAVLDSAAATLRDNLGGGR